MSKSADAQTVSRHSLYAFVRLLVWPVVLLFVLIMFRDPMSDLIRRTSHLEVAKDDKGIRVALVAGNLAIAEAIRISEMAAGGEPSDDGGPRHMFFKRNSLDLEAVADTATRATDSVTLSQAKILWVDDNPDNNLHEQNALEALGVEIVRAINTDQALGRLRNAKFNLVISDFQRRDDPLGGYTLLDEMKTLNSPPPLIIYSSSSDPQHEEDAKAHGAYGQTNSPQRLFDLTLEAIATSG